MINHPYPLLAKSAHLLKAIVDAKVIEYNLNGEWVFLKNPLESINRGFIAKLRIRP